MTVRIFLEDDIAIDCHIFKNGWPEPVDPASVVTGNLRDATAAVGPVVDIVESQPGSDWPAGVVIFAMSSIQTGALTPVDVNAGVHVEIQIIDPTFGRQTVTFPYIEITGDTLP